MPTTTLLALLLSVPARADTFEPADLLMASQRGLPDSTLQLMAAGIDDPSAEVKACLLYGGVPETIVASMAGPQTTTLGEGERPERCAALGLDLTELNAEQQAQAARARQAYAARQAQVDAAQRIQDLAECQRLDAPAMKWQTEEAAEELEDWIRAQILAGRPNLISLDWDRSYTYQGSGGGSTTKIVCAWAHSP
jgi:hypothetical protein